MIQKLFSLYTHPDESHHLHVEVGANHIVCWCTGNETAFTALEFFTFTYDNTEGGFIDTFREIKRSSILLSNTFASEEIVWENASFMCIPNSLFSQATAASFLGLVNSASYQSAPMSRPLQDYVLAYTADSVLYKIVAQHLPSASHSHKLYQLLLQQKGDEKDSVFIHFYQTHFVLVVYKNGTLQLAAAHPFTTPQDVVYHILNATDKLEVPKEAVTILSGFIDEASALYKEMYSYIDNIRFAETGKTKDEHPAHYFTTYNLPLS